MGNDNMSLNRRRQGRYTSTNLSITETEVLQAAEDILRRRYERGVTLTNPGACGDYLRMRLAGLQHEEFHIVWLDQRQRVICTEKLFNGTIDGSSVHPREVVRAALKHNAAAAILAHNHPSGVAEPSVADQSITTELKQILGSVGCRVLDHFVIGSGHPTSFAARGWL